MRMAKNCGATHLMIYGDSYLVVQQTMKSCDAIADNMIAYIDLYNQLEGTFDGCKLRHVGRDSNEEADILANMGSDRVPVPPGVFLERITQRSIKTRPAAKPSTPATSTANPPSQEKEPMEVMLVEAT